MRVGGCRALTFMPGSARRRATQTVKKLLEKRRKQEKFVLRAIEEINTSQNALIRLNEKKAPRSYLHRSNPNDVARVEQFTFICTPTKAEAGPTNNWSEPGETYSKLRGLLKGAMRGRTMFVVPYIMGPPDSSLTKIGF